MLSRSVLLQQTVIVVIATVLFLSNLGAAGLWDADEAVYSSIAREMTIRGDWIVPTFNASMFPEKPPLMYWLMMGSFKVLGVSEFATRLPSAILAIGTVLATYHLARRLFSARVGFWAGLIVASNILFVLSGARAATVDSALAFVTTLTMALFARGARLGEPREAEVFVTRLEEPREAQEKAAPGRLAFVPASSLIYIAIGLLLGLAVLAKGPIGFLLPAASLGLFLLLMNAPVPATRTCKDASKPHSKVWLQTRGFLAQLAATLSPRNFLGVVRSMRPLTVLAVALLVAAPWFVLVAVKTDGQWLEEFVTKFNLRPFASPFLGHRGPFFYHFLVVLVGLFPWSVFLGPTVVNAWREIRGRGRETPCYVFLVCWIGLFFGFWSVCSTKLPHYVLPAYPALAILTACFLDAWLKRREVAARYVMPTATAIFLAVGLLMLVLLPWIAARYAPGEEIIALVGLGLFPGGCAAMYFLFRDRRRAYLATIAASSLLFIILFFSWAELRVDRHQHSRPLMAALHGDSPAAPQIAGYKYCDPSTIYYAGGPVARFDDADELRGFIERSSHPYVVTTENDRKVLESQMPGQWRLVARRPRFLSKGDIVVLAPRLRSPEVGRCEEAMRQGNGETFRK